MPTLEEQQRKGLEQVQQGFKGAEQLDVQVQNEPPSGFPTLDELRTESLKLRGLKPEAPTEPSVLGEFGKGVASGVEETGAGLTALAGTALSAAGAEDAGQALLEKGQEISAGAPRAAVSRLEDVQTPGEFVKWLAFQAGTQVPIMASIIASGGLAAALREVALRKGLSKLEEKAALEAAKRIGEKKAAAFGAGAFAGTAAVEGGATAQQQFEVTGKARPLDTLVGGLGKAALETATPLLIAAKFGLGPTLTRKLADKFSEVLKTRGLLTRTMLGIGGLGAVEGSTEVAQEAIDIALQNFVDENYDLLGPEARSRLLNSGAAGFFIGGGIGGVGAALTPRQPDELSDNTPPPKYKGSETPKELKLRSAVENAGLPPDETDAAKEELAALAEKQGKEKEQQQLFEDVQEVIEQADKGTEEVIQAVQSAPDVETAAENLGFETNSDAPASVSVNEISEEQDIPEAVLNQNPLIANIWTLEPKSQNEKKNAWVKAVFGPGAALKNKMTIGMKKAEDKWVGGTHNLENWVKTAAETEEYQQELHKMLDEFFPEKDYVVVYKGVKQNFTTPFTQKGETKKQKVGNGSLKPKVALDFGGVDKVAAFRVPKKSVKVLNHSNAFSSEYEVGFDLDGVQLIGMYKGDDLKKLKEFQTSADLKAAILNGDIPPPINNEALKPGIRSRKDLKFGQWTLPGFGQQTLKEARKVLGEDEDAITAAADQGLLFDLKDLDSANGLVNVYRGEVTDTEANGVPFTPQIQDEAVIIGEGVDDPIQTEGLEAPSVRVLLVEPDGSIWVRETAQGHKLPGGFTKGEAPSASAINALAEQIGLGTDELRVLGEYQDGVEHARVLVAKRTQGTPQPGAETMSVKMVSPELAFDYLDDKISREAYADYLDALGPDAQAKADHSQQDVAETAGPVTLQAEYAEFVQFPELDLPAPIKNGEQIFVGTKVGDQQGSNEGGRYLGLWHGENTLLYVKKAKSHLHAAVEQFASGVYAVFDLPHAIYSTVEKGGNTFIVSPIAEGLEKLKEGAYAEAVKGFPVDVLLRNHDVVGLEFDNMLQQGEVPFRLDFGGTLFFRAQGGVKNDGLPSNVSDWDSMLDPSINPNTAKVFAKAKTKEGLEAMRETIERMKSSDHREVIASMAKNAFGESVWTDALVARLFERMDNIVARWENELNAKETVHINEVALGAQPAVDMEGTTSRMKLTKKLDAKTATALFFVDSEGYLPEDAHVRVYRADEITGGTEILGDRRGVVLLNGHNATILYHPDLEGDELHYTLAHELGHMLTYWYSDAVDSNLYESMVLAYHAQETEKSLDEWLADQLAAALAEQYNQVQFNLFPDLGGLLQKVGRAIRAFLKKLGLPELPVGAVRDFLADIKVLNSEGHKLGPAFSGNSDTTLFFSGQGIPPQAAPGPVVTLAAEKRQIADMDVYSWGVKHGWTLLQLIDKNPHIRGLQDYGNAVQQWNNEKMRWISRADQRVKEWQSLGLEQGDALAQLWFDMTNMVYLKRDGSGKLIEEARWPTQEEFQSLVRKNGVEEKALKLFFKVREDFDAVLNAVEEIRIAQAEENLTGALLDKELAQIKQDMENMRKAPYFPLTRFGDYTVVVRDVDEDKVVHVEMFESERARDKAFQKIKKRFKDDKYQVRKDKIPEDIAPFRNMPPQLANFIAEQLGLSEEKTEQLKELLFQYSPSRSFAKHFERRTSIGGWSENGLRNYADYFFSGAGHLARLKYGADLETAIKRMEVEKKDLARAGADVTKRQMIIDHVKNHMKYIMEPKNEWAALRGLGFLWHLGFNVKSAAVNLTQVPLVAAPYLSARFGDFKAVKALGKAMREVVGVYRDKKMRKLEKEFYDALNLAVEQGFVDESQATELAGVAREDVLQRVIPGSRGARLVRDLGAAGAWMFQSAEKFNRRVVFRAAWALAMKEELSHEYLQELKDKNQKLYADLLTRMSDREALAFLAGKDAVVKTQYEYAKWNRPRFMQGRKSVVFLFYNYLQNTLWFMRYSPGRGRAILMMLMAAGLMGLPGAEDLRDVIRLLARNLFGKDFDVERELREAIVAAGSESPDLWLHGASRYGFGLGVAARAVGVPIPDTDMSGSLSLGRIVPGLDAVAPPGDFEGKFLRASTDITGPVFGMGIATLQALSDPHPDGFKRWSRMMPAVLRNLQKAAEYAREGGAVTRSGALIEPIDVNSAEGRIAILSQALGFSLTDVNQRWDQQRMLMEQAAFYEQQRRLLLAQYDWAKEHREGLAEVRRAIRDYNRMVPTPKLRIRGDTLHQSRKARERARRAVERFRPAQKGLRPVAREVRALFPEVEAGSPPARGPELVEEALPPGSK